MARGVLAHGWYSVKCKAAQALAGALVVAGCGACSLTMPFETKSASLAADPEITGSIAPRASGEPTLPPGQVSPFSPKIDEEDWRRARAAMATALDPQGNGGNVRWENADSGAKGSFSPVGDPYLVKDNICRLFLAMVSTKEPEQWFAGSACRINATDWQIKDSKPVKKTG